MPLFRQSLMLHILGFRTDSSSLVFIRGSFSMNGSLGLSGLQALGEKAYLNTDNGRLSAQAPGWLIKAGPIRPPAAQRCVRRPLFAGIMAVPTEALGCCPRIDPADKSISILQRGTLPVPLV